MGTASEDVQRGKQHLGNLRLREADQAFSRALKAEPSSIEALIGAARVALMEGRENKATELIDRLLLHEPHHAEALAIRATSLMAKGEHERAATILEDARNLAPNLAMVHANLGACYRAVGQRGAAEEALRKAIALEPGSAFARYELGLLLLESGREPEGIEELKGVLRANPLYVRGYLTLGEIYRRTGRGELAITLYREGLRSNRALHPLREALADLLALKLDFGAARTEAEDLAVMRGGAADHLRVGTYALALGDAEGAEASFKKSLAVRPDQWEARYNLGELYRSLGLVEEARQQLKAAVERGGDQFETWNGLGLFLMHQGGNPEEAGRCFLRASELAPERPEPALNLSLVYSMLQMRQAARKFAELARDLSPVGDSVNDQAERLLTALA